MLAREEWLMKSERYPNLSRLTESDELWQHVKDFDGLLDRSKSRLPVDDGDSEIAKVAHLLNEFATAHFFSTLVFRFKTREIARGILDAESQENLVVLFNLARAFMEHTASLAFQNQALEKAVAEIETKQTFEQFDRTIRKHRKVVDRVYYGGEGSPRDAKRLHTNDLLEALAKVDQRASKDYATLCEFVHPNYGSNLLVSSGELSAGSIGLPSEAMKNELYLARNVIERCAALDWELVISGTRHLSKIENWIDTASAEGTKLSQLFSVRVGHSGDGKTKETAIFFKKARTHNEAIQAFYLYLERQGISLHQRRLAAVEGGFLFDIVLTDKGPLWIKYHISE
jgi:hypothetical protein